MEKTLRQLREASLSAIGTAANLEELDALRVKYLGKKGELTAVLKMMGKPSNDVYKKFIEKYKRLNQKMGKNQFVVPYLMSSHPGSTLKEAIALAEYLRDLGYMPEQVQDFYPTPSTISTVMYYTGLDPRTMKPVYVPTNPHEKAMQRALIQYRNPKNYYLVKEALETAGREDLIGFDKRCLIRPPGGKYAPRPDEARRADAPKRGYGSPRKSDKSKKKTRDSRGEKPVSRGRSGARTKPAPAPKGRTQSSKTSNNSRRKG